VKAARRNITHVVEDALCTGCGVCENACSTSAIRLGYERGLIVPRVDASLCTTCGVCDRVCPGHSVQTEELAGKLFAGIDADVELGRVAAAYSGHCRDEETRRRGATGGMVTGLLRWLLNSGQIDGAIVVRFQADSPLEPEAFIARSEEELGTARSSKYSPVSLGGVLRAVLRTPGKYAVVGLPCHLHGIRKMEQLYPEVARRLVWHLGIFCSGTRSRQATEFYLAKIGAPAGEVREFAYRDEGCLGNMRVALRNGDQWRWPYKQYYPLARSFFLPPRCALCHDQCAELADLAFGDLHIPEFWEDTTGTGCVIARSPVAKTLLANAHAAQAIVLSPLVPSLIRKSQRPMLRRKKQDVPARARLLRALGQKMPAYDAVFPRLTARDLFRAAKATAVLKVENWIGARRCLWWLIHVLGHATPPSCVSGRSVSQ